MATALDGALHHGAGSLWGFAHNVGMGGLPTGGGDGSWLGWLGSTGLAYGLTYGLYGTVLG